MANEQQQHDDSRALVEGETDTYDQKAQNHEDEDDGGLDVELPELLPLKKKKKRKQKPKSQRGKDKPTGFEEYHADAPMTPEQHAENQELYSQSIPFIRRILTAVQRFERTRKLTPERRDIFYKYLAYGGVEVGPNMFQGGQDTSEMDKSDLAAALSRTSISSDKEDLDTPTSKYAVDFTGCIQGFLSRRAIYFYGFDTRELVALVTTTLERFMDYLLQHDVCPEYEKDVLAARGLCRTATDELWNLAEACRALPGDFNIACSTLCGGSYARNYDAISAWDTTTDNLFVGLTPEVASQITGFGIAGAAPEAVYRAYLEVVNGRDELSVIEIKEQTGFEITSIIPPSNASIDMYKSSPNKFQPVGQVLAKPWRNPNSPPKDLTHEEQILLQQQDAPDGDTVTEQQESYVFLLESHILSGLRVGTKLEATIHRLNIGLCFFDDFLKGYPTFDKFLCNELMMDWKEPRAIRGMSTGFPVDGDIADATAADNDENTRNGDVNGEGKKEQGMNAEADIKKQ